MNKELKKPLIFLTLFGIAMAFLETMIVFYLRKIYYPLGFNFPLKFMPEQIVSLEWIREIFTIVMILSIAVIAGKNFMQRFAAFLYLFAVWDIFYYVWLKAILDWPASFLTWDVLFLIPTGWLGPVLAPIILSLTMILFAACIVYLDKKAKIKPREWFLLIAGSIIILLTFIWDYSAITIKAGFPSYLELMRLIGQHTPIDYNWPLFIVGEALLLYAIWLFYKRTKKS